MLRKRRRPRAEKSVAEALPRHMQGTVATTETATTTTIRVICQLVSLPDNLQHRGGGKTSGLRFA
jgi:hypothetical protein